MEQIDCPVCGSKFDENEEMLNHKKTAHEAFEATYGKEDEESDQRDMANDLNKPYDKVPKIPEPWEYGGADYKREGDPDGDKDADEAGASDPLKKVADISEGYNGEDYTETCPECGKVFDNPADAGFHAVKHDTDRATKGEEDAVGNNDSLDRMSTPYDEQQGRFRNSRDEQSPLDNVYQVEEFKPDTSNYEVDVDEYTKTGEPTQKLPTDKRADENGEDDKPSWVDDNPPRGVEPEEANESVGEDWYNNSTEVEQEQILLAAGVDVRHLGLEWINLGQENQALIREEYYEAREVKKLGGEWHKISTENRVKLFEGIGLTQADAYTLAGLDYRYITEAVKKDIAKERHNIDLEDTTEYIGDDEDEKKEEQKDEEETNEAYEFIYNLEKNHRSRDFKKKNLICTRCNESFYRSIDRNVHFNEVHMNAEEYELPDQCPFCKEIIQEPETLDWHMQEQHDAHIPSTYTQTGIQGAMADTGDFGIDQDFYSEAFDTDWSCPKCGNKNVKIKYDEDGNPSGRECPKCGLGKESKAKEDWSQYDHEDLYPTDPAGDEQREEGYLTQANYDMSIQDMNRLYVDRMKESLTRAIQDGGETMNWNYWENLLNWWNTSTAIFDLPYSKGETPEAQQAFQMAHQEVKNWFRDQKQSQSATLPSPSWESISNILAKEDFDFDAAEPARAKLLLDGYKSGEDWVSDPKRLESEDGSFEGWLSYSKKFNLDEQLARKVWSGESRSSDLKKEIKKLTNFINMASFENPMNMGDDQAKLDSLKAELASLGESRKRAKELFGQDDPDEILGGSFGTPEDTANDLYNMTSHNYNEDEYFKWVDKIGKKVGRNDTGKFDSYSLDGWLRSQGVNNQDLVNDLVMEFGGGSKAIESRANEDYVPEPYSQHFKWVASMDQDDYVCKHCGQMMMIDGDALHTKPESEIIPAVQQHLATHGITETYVVKRKDGEDERVADDFIDTYLSLTDQTQIEDITQESYSKEGGPGSGPQPLNDSHKSALDKYVSQYGDEDKDIIMSLASWDKDMHLPPEILSQVKDASDSEILDYIRSKTGESKATEQNADKLMEDLMDEDGNPPDELGVDDAVSYLTKMGVPEDEAKDAVKRFGGAID